RNHPVLITEGVRHQPKVHPRAVLWHELITAVEQPEIWLVGSIWARVDAPGVQVANGRELMPGRRRRKPPFFRREKPEPRIHFGLQRVQPEAHAYRGLRHGVRLGFCATKLAVRFFQNACAPATFRTSRCTPAKYAVKV